MEIKYLNKKGFTLIELIAVLIIVGVMGALAGLGIVQIVNGYMFAKKNADTAQKAQLAMSRIVKELGDENTVVSSGTSSSVVFDRDSTEREFYWSTGNPLRIRTGISHDTLIDTAAVNSFDLEYLTSYDAVSSSSCVPFPGSPLCSDMNMIQITLELNGPEDIPITFIDRVYLGH